MPRGVQTSEALSFLPAVFTATLPLSRTQWEYITSGKTWQVTQVSYDSVTTAGCPLALPFGVLPVSLLRFV